jgi:CRISPR-associated endonuclease/helicase Cas3
MQGKSETGMETEQSMVSRNAGFWAKTMRAASSASDQVAKSVLHHLMDVAAAALRLQEANPARLRRETSVVGVPAERLTRTSAFLAGLHDLGKFSVPFQAKVPELWPAALLGPFPGPVHDRGHWRNTAIILRWQAAEQELQSLFPELCHGLEIIAGSIAGHHGQPPAHDEYRFNRHGFAHEKEVTRPCLDAAVEAMRALRDLVRPESLPEITDQEQAQAMSWRLAGLTTLADWIGSDATFFRFEDPAMPLADYWRLALKSAEEAIEAKGLLPLPARAGAGFPALAPGMAARPMQEETDRMPLGEGPMLAVIEDSTGSGKTEAALILAARLMAAGKAEGLYFALPTMATANAMFLRLGDIRRPLFADGARPSLVLAHGRADLAHGQLAGVANTGNGGGEDNAAWCAEWIADNRRKAFFADVGAGTIDQAFLAVLKKKHLALRQYGLAGRVLVVDEAHAFDAYMGRELEILLEVHASLGGSAIVLSATLPAAKHQSIVAAFRRGLGYNREAPFIASGSYPLLTAVGRDGLAEHRVAFSDNLRRTVMIERLAEPRAAHARALEAARKGAAVLVIRNAVDEAAASFEDLRAGHEATTLFHARFAMCDRQRIEKDALSRFGRDANPEDRAGHILVATQVVEQSLDLDFDLVISDLAPVDLLIQRAGRLWRHMDRRPRESRAITGPILCVIAPDPAEATHEKWLEPALGRGAFVYQHPGVMWRTARTVFSAGMIRTPDDLRPFIERVYAEEDVPPCLERGQNEAEGKVHSGRWLAGQNLIDFAGGYPAMGAPSADQEIGTRLGEETATLRLARFVGGKVAPWADQAIDRIQPEREHYLGEDNLWALSETSVRVGWLGSVAEPDELMAAIDAAKASWPEWERDAIKVAVVEPGGAVRFDAEGASLRYFEETGLTKHTVATE